MRGLLCFDDICVHEPRDGHILNLVQKDPIISELSSLLYGVSNSNADIESNLEPQNVSIYYDAFELEVQRVVLEYIEKYNKRSKHDFKMWLDNIIHVSIQCGKAYIVSNEDIDLDYSHEIQSIVNTYVDSIVDNVEDFNVHEYSEEICIMVLDVLSYDRPIAIIYPDELNE